MTLFQNYEIHPGDNVVEWSGAYNEDAGTYLDGDATVVFSLLADASDAPGDAISGATAVSMPYVASSSGVFRGILESTVTAGLTVGTKYWIRATATDGTLVGQRDWQVTFTRRGPNR